MAHGGERGGGAGTLPVRNHDWALRHDGGGGGGGGFNEGCSLIKY